MEKMKPFDLEAALAGAKVVTRDGREVKIAGYNEECNSLLGWISSGVYQWTGGGVNMWDKNDLFMAPTERKEWIVKRIRVNSGKPIVKGPFATKESAEFYCEKFQGATIHEITVTE